MRGWWQFRRWAAQSTWLVARPGLRSQACKLHSAFPCTTVVLPVCGCVWPGLGPRVSGGGGQHKGCHPLGGGMAAEGDGKVAEGREELAGAKGGVTSLMEDFDSFETKMKHSTRVRWAALSAAVFAGCTRSAPPPCTATAGEGRAQAEEDQGDSGAAGAVSDGGALPAPGDDQVPADCAWRFWRKPEQRVAPLDVRHTAPAPAHAHSGPKHK